MNIYFVLGKIRICNFATQKQTYTSKMVCFTALHQIISLVTFSTELVQYSNCGVVVTSQKDQCQIYWNCRVNNIEHFSFQTKFLI